MTTRDIVLIALLAAVIVAFGFLPPITPAFIPVPITLQTLGVMLAGALLGPRRGALAVVVVIALVAVGMPVLSGGRGGFGVFAGPTAGFLFGWLPGAYVTGVLARWLVDDGAGAARRIGALFLACAVGGIGAVYLVGIPWLGLVSGLGLGTAAVGTLAFLPGDLIKAAVAALVVHQVRRAHREPLK